MTDGKKRFEAYLKGQTGHFFTLLFDAALRADHENREKLAKGFPEEMAAVAEYRGYLSGLKH